MAALFISGVGNGNDQVVRAPRATDAIGAALRGAFGAECSLPPEMIRLLQRLERR